MKYQRAPSPLPPRLVRVGDGEEIWELGGSCREAATTFSPPFLHKYHQCRQQSQTCPGSPERVYLYHTARLSIISWCSPWWWLQCDFNKGDRAALSCSLLRVSPKVRGRRGMDPNVLWSSHEWSGHPELPCSSFIWISCLFSQTKRKMKASKPRTSPHSNYFVPWIRFPSESHLFQGGPRTWPLTHGHSERTARPVNDARALERSVQGKGKKPKKKQLPPRSPRQAASWDFRRARREYLWFDLPLLNGSWIGYTEQQQITRSRRFSGCFSWFQAKYGWRRCLSV